MEIKINVEKNFFIIEQEKIKEYLNTAIELLSGVKDKDGKPINTEKIFFIITQNSQVICTATYDMDRYDENLAHAIFYEKYLRDSLYSINSYSTARIQEEISEIPGCAVFADYVENKYAFALIGIPDYFAEWVLVEFIERVSCRSNYKIILSDKSMFMHDLPVARVSGLRTKYSQALKNELF